MEQQPTTIRLYGTVPDSIVDGPGLRYAIFVQGCSHACPGCHNPQSHAPDGGDEVAIEELLGDIHHNKLICGVTFSGGEPFEQAHACAAIAQRLHDEGYDIWTYTGYLYEDLLVRAQTNEDVACFLKNIDVLVDGPFIEEQKSLTLKWRGSANQRVIDLHKTQREGAIVLWSEKEFSFDIPPSW